MLEPLMNNQEQRLLRDTVRYYVPEFGTIVEWGSGGSTVFLANNKPQGASLISVEHYKEWYDKVKPEVADIPFVEYCFAPPDDPTWQAFATIEEENPEHLAYYINTPGDIMTVDLFLVDGVARGTILDRIAQEAKPSAVVLLHDAERDWYNSHLTAFTEISRADRLALFCLKVDGCHGDS